MPLHVPAKIPPVPGRPNDTERGLSHDVLAGLHQEQRRFSQYFGGFQEKTVTISGETLVILAKQGGASGDTGPWTVDVFSSTLATVAYGVVFMPMVSVAQATVENPTVLGTDAIIPTINGVPLNTDSARNTMDIAAGEGYFYIELTVNDKNAYTMYGVSAEIIYSATTKVNTLTKRYILIASKSEFGVVTQVSRYNLMCERSGDREQIDNMVRWIVG